MTDEQINHAIAEACGFVLYKTMRSFETDKTFYFWNYPQDWKGKDFSPWLPDFCEDLNAMHEAEKTLNEDQLCKMARYIERNDIRWYFRATARERAEAFLCALDKWEDGK
jgi:hypothetical protein